MVKRAGGSKEAVFGLFADVAQAHRRVLIRQADWGLLGCKARTSSDTLWLNCVGSFGASSASYWWTRLLGWVGRWMLHVLSVTPFWQCVFTGDMRLAAAGTGSS